MASNEELERRIAKLEEQVAELRRDRRTQIQPHEGQPPGPSYPPQPVYLWPPQGSMCSCPPGTVCNNFACPRAPKITCSYTGMPEGNAAQGGGSNHWYHQ